MGDRLGGRGPSCATATSSSTQDMDFTSTCPGTCCWCSRHQENSLSGYPVEELQVHVLREAREDRRHEPFVEGCLLMPFERCFVAKARINDVCRRLGTMSDHIVDKRLRFRLVSALRQLALQALELLFHSVLDDQLGDECRRHALPSRVALTRCRARARAGREAEISESCSPTSAIPR